eukprot:333801-Chlamydomonas_euryale.AAC.1
MSAPGVQAPLAALYQAIDARVGMYQQLLKVYGRLSLITAHAAPPGGGTGDEAGGMPGPEMVFEDASEEEVEAEDPFAPEELSEDDDEEDGDADDDSDGDDDSDDDDELMGDGDDDDLDG